VNKILFICTGNYFRSRFAEAFFNYQAEIQKINWRAYSRGLGIHFSEGDLSPFTKEYLEKNNISLNYTSKSRKALTELDLIEAQIQIALKKSEHFHRMQKQFPQWANRINYWNVHDIDVAQPVESLKDIEGKVLSIIDRIKT